MFATVICLVLLMYLDHLKFCVVCINSRRYVCCSECNVVSNECNEPTSFLVQHIGAHCCEVMYFGCFGLRGELGFLNYDDVCMCVVNKQFELPDITINFMVKFCTLVYILRTDNKQTGSSPYKLCSIFVPCHSCASHT